MAKTKTSVVTQAEKEQLKKLQKFTDKTKVSEREGAETNRLVLENFKFYNKSINSEQSLKFVEQLTTTDPIGIFKKNRVKGIDTLSQLKIKPTGDSDKEKLPAPIKTPDGKTIAEKLNQNELILIDLGNTTSNKLSDADRIKKLNGQEGVYLYDGELYHVGKGSPTQAKKVKNIIGTNNIYNELRDKCTNPPTIANENDLQLLESLGQKTQANEIKQAFKKPFELGSEIEKVEIKFSASLNATINVAKERIEQNGTCNIAVMADFLAQAKADMEKAITAQHETEIKKVEELFTKSSPELDTIKTSMGLKTQEDISKFKDNIITALKDDYNTKKKELDDSINTTIRELKEHEKKEMARIFFLTTMYATSESVRKLIDELAKQNAAKRKPDQDNVDITVDDGSDTFDKFKEIKVTDLQPSFTTDEGTKISIKDDHTLHVKLPRRINASYYKKHGSVSGVEKDLLSTALAVKASGFTHIKWTVRTTTEKFAMELARKQYEAAIKAGFSPEDIKIEVQVKGKQPVVYEPNPKKDSPNKSMNELFPSATEGHRLQEAKAFFQSSKEHAQEAIRENQRSIKEALKEQYKIEEQKILEKKEQEKDLEKPEKNELDMQ